MSLSVSQENAGEEATMYAYKKRRGKSVCSIIYISVPEKIYADYLSRV